MSGALRGIVVIFATAPQEVGTDWTAMPRHRRSLTVLPPIKRPNSKRNSLDWSRDN